MEITKSLTQKIEAEQIRKLQELSSSAPGGQSAGDFLSFGGAPGLHAMNRSASPGAETDFERLVNGKKDGSQAPASSGFSWQTTAAPTAAATNGSYIPTRTAPASPARGQSPAVPTGAQKFPWSSSSPKSSTPPPPLAAMNSGAAGRSQQSSSIDPFSALQPTPSSALGTGMRMGFSTPPIQPSTTGFGSTTAFRQPAASSGSGSAIGGALDWSTSMNNRQGSPMSQPTMNQMNQMNQMNRQPMNQMMSGLNFGGTSSNTPPPGLNGFGATTTGPRKGGGIQLTNFGMGLPPPTVVAAAATAPVAIVPKKNEDKTGLDKWESLI